MYNCGSRLRKTILRRLPRRVKELFMNYSLLYSALVCSILSVASVIIPKFFGYEVNGNTGIIVLFICIAISSYVRIRK